MKMSDPDRQRFRGAADGLRDVSYGLAAAGIVYGVIGNPVAGAVYGAASLGARALSDHVERAARDPARFDFDKISSFQYPERARFFLTLERLEEVDFASVWKQIANDMIVLSLAHEDLVISYDRSEGAVEKQDREAERKQIDVIKENHRACAEIAKRLIEVTSHANNLANAIAKVSDAAFPRKTSLIDEYSISRFIDVDDSPLVRSMITYGALSHPPLLGDIWIKSISEIFESNKRLGES